MPTRDQETLQDILKAMDAYKRANGLYPSQLRLPERVATQLRNTVRFTGTRHESHFQVLEQWCLATQTELIVQPSVYNPKHSRDRVSESSG